MTDRKGAELQVGDRVWFSAFGRWQTGYVRVLRPSIFHNVIEALVDTGNADECVLASWVSSADIQKIEEP